MNPFFIEGPAVISFSGGRTSGYMLYRILEAHGGALPDDVFVSFQNTGKERNETLDFIDECSRRWSVPVTWLEWRPADEPKNRWTIVDYSTAARDGEPFEAVIQQHGFLPNPVSRYCTKEMKIATEGRYLQHGLGWSHWTKVVGLRADEPRRIARLSEPSRERWERVAPLALAGVTVADVGAFWRAQPFDLRLPNMNGKTMHGNCDLCFLKGKQTVESLIREQPERAMWWIRMEQSIVPTGGSNMGNRFRSDRPGYEAMHALATSHGELFDFDDTLDDCACTD